MEHLVSPILHALGIDEKTQFLWMLQILIVAFAVYAVRSRQRYGSAFSIIFVVMAVALFIFFFTESSIARWWSLGVLVISALAAIAWHAFYRTRFMGHS